MTASLRLHQFDAPSHDAWETAARKALKHDADTPLSREDDDGLAINLLYTKSEDTSFDARPDNDVGSAQCIDLPDTDQALQQAHEDVQNGADALILALDDKAAPHSFGVRLNSQNAVDSFCKKLPPHLPLRIETGVRQFELAEWFHAAQRENVETSIDVIGVAARSGSFQNIEADFSRLQAHLQAFPTATLRVDARLFHNAGASDAQEIGFALGCYVETLRQLEKCGLSPRDIMPRFTCVSATDARQFSSIIKLRALRMAHAHLCDVLGISACMNLNVETSRRMLTRQDTPANLIRNTLAAFAAVAGGADSVCVLPHTSALGLADGFARRMARNTLNLLSGEAYVLNVQDPGAGGFYIESMTAQLAEKAWRIFQDIEARGGILSALRSGEVQSMIAQKRDMRMKAYQNKELQIIGVTAFRDPSPQDTHVLAPLPPSCVENSLALNAWRDASAFETALPSEARA